MSYNRNKYKIVLFKNGDRTKVFFSSNSKKSILKKYNKLIEEKKPKFITEYISRKKVMFELAIITTEQSDKSIFVKDSVGRTKKVSLGDSSYHIIKLLPYWKEERIYDHQNKTKISFSCLLENYLTGKEFKQIFSLNNKLIIQQDEIFNLFSLKTVTDAQRLLGIIELDFIDNGRYDCLFVRDTNTVQRKQLYNILTEVGYDRDFLRKQFTY
jgi:hypothetical protein|tara:strand:+ start:60 stop:695 length:636 start_codon:yes stop_codon:yes gene_type:complete